MSNLQNLGLLLFLLLILFTAALSVHIDIIIMYV